MADAFDEALEDNALKPSSVSGDAGSVSQHPLRDQIAFDQYRKAKSAAANNPIRGAWGGLRGARVVPPGTLGEVS